MAKSASRVLPGSPPVHWEKRILYAYLRMMGATQIDAGRAVGRCERTVQDWEYDTTWYPIAREEARKRWLTELVDASRLTLLKTIKEGTNGLLALQVLERMDEDLAPAKQRLDVGVEGGGISGLLAAARANGHLGTHGQGQHEQTAIEN